MWTQFNNMRTRPPFGSEELRQELLRRFDALGWAMNPVRFPGQFFDVA
jgi:hypothetical protein